jgi:hypothetical protein
MNKKTVKMNTVGVVLIIIIAILAILAIYYLYSPPAPMSDTIHVPLQAPAPLNNNPPNTPSANQT